MFKITKRTRRVIAEIVQKVSRKGIVIGFITLVPVLLIILHYSHLQMTNGDMNVYDSIITSLQTMDPYKYAALEHVQCEPLLVAVNHEAVCRHSGDEANNASWILQDGVMEGKNVAVLKQILELNPSHGLIDIGVNLGFHTVTVASMRRYVVAIELYAPNLPLLAQTMRLNPHLIPFITVVTNAVSDKYGTVEISSNRRPEAEQVNSTGERPLDGVYSNSILDQNFDIAVIRTDDIIDIIQFKKAILRISIEGAEREAIRSSTNIFDTVDITHVFMKWDQTWEEKSVEFMIMFFIQRGYSVHKPFGDFERLDILSPHLWTSNILWRQQSMRVKLTGLGRSIQHTSLPQWGLMAKITIYCAQLRIVGCPFRISRIHW